MNEWVRRLGLGLAVVLMMAVGLAILVAAIMVDPAHMVTGSTDLTDMAVVKFLIGMLALLLLPFYRRAPLVLIGVGAFCAAILGTDPFVLSVGLAVWIGRAEKRWHWLVAAAGVAAIGVNAARILHMIWQWPDGDRKLGITVTLAILLLCLALIASISQTSRERRRTREASAIARSARHDSAELSGELARQREREDLAREVHDTLASRLSAIALQTGSLEDAARDVGDPVLDDAMRTVRANATNALTDLRSLLRSLREGGAPSVSPHSAPGGMSDLHDLFADAAASGLAITPFVVVDSYGEAPDTVRRAVVRITQEALTNALRHSSDQAVGVRIEGAPGAGLHLEYANSVGYGPPTFEGGSKTGLLGIEERVRLVGGQVSHYRAEGRFVLSIDLPWAAEGAPHRSVSPRR